MHDRIVTKKAEQYRVFSAKGKGIPDEVQNTNDIEMKGQSLVLKLSAVVEALSFFCHDQRSSEWIPEVQVSSMNSAITIVESLIGTKCELLNVSK